MDEEKATPAIDKVIHERVRLLILTHLAGKPASRIAFNELKDSLELTAGNLSIQLKNLEAAGYINIHKRIKNNKPETTVTLTPAGLTALMDYLTELERIIRSVKDAGRD